MSLFHPENERKKIIVSVLAYLESKIDVGQEIGVGGLLKNPIRMLNFGLSEKHSPEYDQSCIFDIRPKPKFSF